MILEYRLLLGGTAITITGTGSGTLTYLRTLYGLGDGNTTFNVPDLRNDFTRGSSSTNFIGIHQDDTVGDFNVTLPMVNQTLSFILLVHKVKLCRTQCYRFCICSTRQWR